MDSNKFKLSLLLLAVLVPIGLSTWLYLGGEFRGFGGTTNKGVLVRPVLDITALQLTNGRGTPAYQPFEALVEGVSPEVYAPRPWQLLYLGGPVCDDTCRERLYFLRQLHVRLGRDTDRVQRVYVLASPAATTLERNTELFLAQEHGGMAVVHGLSGVLQGVLGASARPGEDPVSAHYIYVVDPVGNVMLYFTPENSAEDILSDLEHLLDQSSLG